MVPISELDLIKIGEIVKAHGFRGETVIKLSVSIGNLKNTEMLFLETEGIMVPFFLSNNPRPFKQSSIIVKFNSLNSDKEVKGLLKSSVFTIRKNLIPERASVYETLFGYDVYDNQTFLGKAGEYLNIPSNPILTVISVSKSEILIPINKSFVKDIDSKNKKITFNLPEGLLDVNL